MTICIAAAIEPTNALITISDKQIGLGDFAADLVAQKEDFIHRHWTAMVSAEDISLASPFWDRARRKLGYIDGQTVQVGEKTAAEVKEACALAYKEYRSELVAAKYYAPHGLTEERFVSEGKKLLGLSLFTEVWNLVDRFTTDFSFLVSGFDIDGQPAVFE